MLLSRTVQYSTMVFVRNRFFRYTEMVSGSIDVRPHLQEAALYAGDTCKENGDGCAAQAAVRYTTSVVTLLFPFPVSLFHCLATAVCYFCSTTVYSCARVFARTASSSQINQTARNSFGFRFYVPGVHIHDTTRSSIPHAQSPRFRAFINEISKATLHVKYQKSVTY